MRIDELKKQLVCPRPLVENFTSEALSTLLSRADETIFSCSADASDVFNVLPGEDDPSDPRGTKGARCHLPGGAGAVTAFFTP